MPPNSLFPPLSLERFSVEDLASAAYVLRILFLARSAFREARGSGTISIRIALEGKDAETVYAAIARGGMDIVQVRKPSLREALAELVARVDAAGRAPVVMVRGEIVDPAPIDEPQAPKAKRTIRVGDAISRLLQAVSKAGLLEPEVVIRPGHAILRAGGHVLAVHHYPIETPAPGLTNVARAVFDLRRIVRKRFRALGGRS